MSQNNPASDIRTQLIADGVTTPIFTGGEPKSPNEVITIYNTSEEPPSPKFLLDFPGLQVRCRSTSYDAAYAILLGVFDILVGRPPFVVSTTRYTGVMATTNILEIGRDENDRRILVFNLKLITEAQKGTQHRKAL